MNLTFRSVLLLLLALGLAGGGYAWWRGQAREEAIMRQAANLEALLRIANQRTGHTLAEYMGMVNYYTCLNQNQRQDLAVQQQCQLISKRTRTLTDTLQEYREHVRRSQVSLSSKYNKATGQNRINNLNQNIVNEHLISFYSFMKTRMQKKIHLDSMHSFLPTDFSRQPQPLQAMRLIQLESHVWRIGADGLRGLISKVGGNYDGFFPIKAVAIAPVATVAPGAVYKANLYLQIPVRHCVMKSAASISGAQIEYNTRIDDNQEGVTIKVASQQTPPSDTTITYWRGFIRILNYPWQTPYSHDTTVVLDVPYFIVK